MRPIPSTEPSQASFEERLGASPATRQLQLLVDVGPLPRGPLEDAAVPGAAAPVPKFIPGPPPKLTLLAPPLGSPPPEVGAEQTPILQVPLPGQITP